VQGEYEKFLESAAGKQAQAQTRVFELQAQLGKLINLALIPILEIGVPVIRFFTSMSDSLKKTIVVTAALAFAGFKIITIIKAMGFAINFSLGPVGLLIAALTALLFWVNSASAAEKNLAEKRRNTAKETIALIQAERKRVEQAIATESRIWRDD